MEVKLLHISPIELIINGIRTCYQSQENSDSYYETGTCFWGEAPYKVGPKDKALIKRIIESGHTSTLEHSLIAYNIEGFSRDVLQELSRHRIGVGPSVKSSRYTIKELKDEDSFLFGGWQYERAAKYVVLTGNEFVDNSIIEALDNARSVINSGVPNDLAKYCLPGAYKTSGQYSFNFRSLRHLLELRTSPRALWEFRILAYKLYEVLPVQYKFLVEDCVYKDEKNN